MRPSPLRLPVGMTSVQQRGSSTTFARERLLDFVNIGSKTILDVTAESRNPQVQSPQKLYATAGVNIESARHGHVAQSLERLVAPQPAWLDSRVLSTKSRRPASQKCHHRRNMPGLLAVEHWTRHHSAPPVEPLGSQDGDSRPQVAAETATAQRSTSRRPDRPFAHNVPTVATIACHRSVALPQAMLPESLDTSSARRLELPRNPALGSAENRPEGRTPTVPVKTTTHLKQEKENTNHTSSCTPRGASVSPPPRYPRWSAGLRRRSPRTTTAPSVSELTIETDRCKTTVRAAKRR